MSIILQDFGLEEDQAHPIVEQLSKDRKRWVDFMMRFELDLERPERLGALRSGQPHPVILLVQDSPSLLKVEGISEPARMGRPAPTTKFL